MMCPRFPICIFRNLGCEKGAEEECDYFCKINSALADFKEKIESILKKEGVFLYNDSWYVTAIRELLEGLHISSGEVARIEDETIDDVFLKKEDE